MRTITRIFGWVITSVVVASVASALAVAATKRRIVVEDPEANEIHLVAALEPIRYVSRSTAFRGGSVEAWYGGGIVDLRHAELDPAGARLTIRTVFGGFEVAVPEEWRVVATVQGIGGVGDNRPHVERAKDAPTLTIDGTALFGGIGIVSVVTEDEERSIGEAIVRSERGRRRMAELVARARTNTATWTTRPGGAPDVAGEAPRDAAPIPEEDAGSVASEVTKPVVSEVAQPAA
jgi:hypothetical protein